MRNKPIQTGRKNWPNHDETWFDFMVRGEKMKQDMHDFWCNCAVCLVLACAVLTLIFDVADQAVK